MCLIETVLRQMSGIPAPQRKFITVLLTTWMCGRGKVNYRNLSRYSEIHEKTYSRWFRREFDCVEFNRLSLSGISARSHNLVAALDCSFTGKSGNHTDGLDKFYNSHHGKPEKGLDISTLALVDVTYHTAYPLCTRQTPKLDNPDETRVDWYLHPLEQDRPALPQGVRYRLTDGDYSKTKFVEGVVELSLHLVGKRRHDAELRYL
jgi:hypothetical protein